jgi:protein-disulfide isomerase
VTFHRLPNSVRGARAALGSLVTGVVLALAVPVHAEPAVAMVAGKPILESELIEGSQAAVLNLRKQEYDARRRALESLIDKKVLEAEAARRGMSINTLTREVEQVAEPTPGEVEAFYLATRDQLQRSLDDVREQMRNALVLAKRTAARDALMKSLRARLGVQVLLESPRVEVAVDPLRSIGPADAPVRIVEFSDFECPYCRSVERTIKALLVKYPGKVSVAYRDFPLTGLHPGAQRAAEASRCAAQQGKFWPYHDRLFASGSLDIAQLKDHAREIGLDQKQFDSCVDGGSMRAAVDLDAQQGRLVGVSATPTFFINGIPLSGAQPAAAFERIIDEELARVSRQATASASR